MNNLDLNKLSSHIENQLAMDSEQPQYYTMNNFSIIPSKQILLYNEQLAMDSEQPQYYTMNNFSIIHSKQNLLYNEQLAIDSEQP